MQIINRKILIYLFVSLIIGLFFYLPQRIDYPQKVAELDQKLIQFLAGFDINSASLIRSIQHNYSVKGRALRYMRRDFRIASQFPLRQFSLHLKKYLKRNGFELKEIKEKAGYRYDIYLGSYPVYTLLLLIKPKFILVLDDWGYNLKFIDFLKEVDIPLNIAILPALKYTKDINKQALNFGHEVLLHLPMEPQAKETHKLMEKETILLNMEEDKIKSLINKFLEELPNVKGVNNHMGSLVSQEPKLMGFILKEINKRGLYYLDSLVIKGSVAEEIASQIGLNYYKRDIFLDDINDRKIIIEQLHRAERIAEERGYVIVIGHAREKTIKILEERLPELKKKFQFCKLSSLKLKIDESFGN